MKRRMTFKVPPTRRQRGDEILEGLLRAMQEEFPGERLRVVESGEDRSATLAEAGAFKASTVSVVTYLHEAGCPKARVQAFAADAGDVYAAQHGPCTCGPEVVTVIAADEVPA